MDYAIKTEALPADGAVTEPPAGRAGPAGVHQRLLGFLSVPDLQAPTTELTSHSHTLAGPEVTPGLLIYFAASNPFFKANTASQSV